MKNLVILFVILGVFGFGNSRLTEAKALSKLIPLSQALKNNNFDESNLGKLEVYCMSQIAKRVNVQDFGPINYSFIIFWADDQLNYPGEFWVSPDTKCFKGDLPEKFTGKKWRFAHFFHPFPSQVDFIAYIVNKHDPAKPYCRTSVGWARDYQMLGIGWVWKETTFQKVVVYIPSNQIEDFNYPSKPFGGVYFNRNITCFKTLKQAEKGGYKLIKW